MEYFINNFAYFSLNSEIHNTFTSNKTCLHLPQVNLSLYQEGVYDINIRVLTVYQTV
jgi:hypothetical protein